MVYEERYLFLDEFSGSPRGLGQCSSALTHIYDVSLQKRVPDNTQHLLVKDTAGKSGVVHRQKDTSTSPKAAEEDYDSQKDERLMQIEKDKYLSWLSEPEEFYPSETDQKDDKEHIELCETAQNITYKCHNCKNVDDDSKEKVPPKFRIHRRADSLLSTSSGFSNFRGVLNWALILFALTSGRVALENVIKYGILVDPLSLLEVFLENPLQWPSVILTLTLPLFVFWNSL